MRELAWAVGVFGEVVAVDGDMIAVQLEDPGWTGLPRNLLAVFQRNVGGMIGEAVSLGGSHSLLFCRYFAAPVGPDVRVAVGDRVSIQFGRTNDMQRDWQGRSEWCVQPND
ncbi:MAG: hypothetical protein AB8H80_12995 [Planctomycetota bacterium]